MRSGELDFGPQAGGVTDGDKGDIVVSGAGGSWVLDPALLSVFMRGVLPAVDAPAARVALGAQTQSAILDATTASFLTTHATKLGHIAVTQAVDLDAIEARVIALDAAVILRGAWDASAGTFPGGGTAQAGDSWIVSVAGTVGGVAFAINDRIIAIVDNASTTVFAANWFKADYTDQVLSVAGKTGAVTLQVADITDMSANGRSLVSAANYAAMQTLLGNDLKAPLASPTFSGIVTTAGQIKFPAVFNPSADVNTLDDYEEFTWNPVRGGFTEVLGGGAIAVAGTYTKIGRLVFITATITPSGGATIAAVSATSVLSGLPFTPLGTVPGDWINTSTEGASGALAVRAAGMVVVTSWAASSDARSFSAVYQTT